MAKVTTKLQVTIPKALATRHRIAPGDDVEWSDAGDAIRLEPAANSSPGRAAVEVRLQWFDAATARQRMRESAGLIVDAMPKVE